jgi:hypothetical protein
MKHEFSKVMETIVQENNLAEYIITFWIDPFTKLKIKHHESR